MTIISQEAMEKALQQNFDNEDRDALEASQYAAVKEYLKTVLAEQVFKAPSDLSGSMKEHWARQTKEYKEHLKAIQQAQHKTLRNNFHSEDNQTLCSQFQTLFKSGAI